MKKFCYLFFVFLLPACSSATPTAQAEPLRVQFTFSAQPWLADLTACAGENAISAELRSAGFLNLTDSDLVLRLGDAGVSSPAYQIGTEDILVIVNPQNPVTRLTAEEVLGIFTGSIQNWQDINSENAPVQVWVFAAGEEVQRIFEQTALSSAPITSLARLAPGPEEMARAIAEDVNAIGILTRQWLMDDVSEIYSAAALPVLALTPDNSNRLVSETIACLQK